MGDLAASGGFYIAVACPKIVATPGTLTGSIGVISQFPNLKGLAQRFDFKMETVKSGAAQGRGEPLPRHDPGGSRLLAGADRRRVPAVPGRGGRGARTSTMEKVKPIADGRVITGEEAKERGLVDALGNLYDAVDLAKARGQAHAASRCWSTRPTTGPASWSSSWAARPAPPPTRCGPASPGRRAAAQEPGRLLPGAVARLQPRTEPS